MGNGGSLQGTPAASSSLTSNKKWEVTCNQHRTFICRFCLGASCKRENYKLQKRPCAVDGLHSDYVTDDIVAMQRPSTRLIKEHSIIDQFKKQNIGAILCLQTPGEHPHCGDGIHPEGLSYLPEAFMDHGVFFYNFFWIDMAVPTNDLMVRCVKSMDMHVQRKQKVAVHCHAGMGRTGLAIVCYILYKQQMDVDQAIQLIRTKRPGSVQTAAQQAFCQSFAQWLKELRIIFALPTDSNETPYFNLVDVLERQHNLLHGEERMSMKKIPKLLYVICTELQTRAQKNGAQCIAEFVKGIHGIGQTEKVDQRHLEFVKTQINEDNWRELTTLPSNTLITLLLDWLESLSAPVIEGQVLMDVALGKNEGQHMFDATVAEVATGTLNCIFWILRQLENHGDEREIDLVYMRFAFALMHPCIEFPSPPPFRTLRRPDRTSTVLDVLLSAQALCDPSSYPMAGVACSPSLSSTQRKPYAFLFNMGKHLRLMAQAWVAFCKSQPQGGSGIRKRRVSDVTPSFLNKDLTPEEAAEAAAEIEQDLIEQQGAGRVEMGAAAGVGVGVVEVEAEAEGAVEESKPRETKLLPPLTSTPESEKKGTDVLDENISDRICQLFNMLSSGKQTELLGQLVGTQKIAARRAKKKKGSLRERKKTLETGSLRPVTAPPKSEHVS